MLYPRIASELLDMGRVDQEMRPGNPRQSKRWDAKVDQRHTNRMKELVKQIGWPTVSKVGHEAAHAAWLLVQHADHDVDFQKKCLTLMKSELETEVERRCIAYLEDRVRVNLGQPQLYGTQFDEVDGNFVPRVIENPEQVDERRLQMGLGTLQEGIEEMYDAYRTETEGST